MILSKVIIALGVLLLAVCGIDFFYWHWAQGEIVNLNKNVSSLQIGIAEQQKVIEQQTKQAEIQSQAIEKLQNDLIQSNQSNTALQNILHKHNLEELARKRTKQIQDQMNAATQRKINKLQSETQLKR
jgi:hypothetical protein